MYVNSNITISFDNDSLINDLFRQFQRQTIILATGSTERCFCLKHIDDLNNLSYGAKIACIHRTFLKKFEINK